MEAIPEHPTLKMKKDYKVNIISNLKALRPLVNVIFTSLLLELLLIKIDEAFKRQIIFITAIYVLVQALIMAIFHLDYLLFSTGDKITIRNNIEINYTHNGTDSKFLISDIENIMIKVSKAKYRRSRSHFCSDEYFYISIKLNNGVFYKLTSLLIDDGFINLLPKEKITYDINSFRLIKM